MIILAKVAPLRKSKKALESMSSAHGGCARNRVISNGYNWMLSSLFALLAPISMVTTLQRELPNRVTSA